MKINVEISAGELIDKISILKIKLLKIKDKKKIKEVKKEYELLIKKTKNIKNYDFFFKKMFEVNMNLWKIEDDIRKMEKIKNFGKSFVKLARSVYICNDKRFKIKNEINSILKSNIFEQKSYEKY